MKTLVRALLLAALVAGTGAVFTCADGLSPEWLTAWRDPANTVSTPVPLSDTLNVLWSAPAGGSPPLVYVNSLGEHLVISGHCVYDAWTGDLVHWVPNAGDRAAISEGVLLTGRPRDGFHNSQYEFFAYDLDTFEFELEQVGYLDACVSLRINASMRINAKNGVFYITGKEAEYGIAAVDPLTQEVVWEKLQSELPVCGTCRGGCAVANVDGVGDVVFVGFYSGGVVALRASDAFPLWHVQGYGHYDAAPPCVDEANGIVFADYEFNLRAYDARTGEILWSAPFEDNNILNGPATLGEVNGEPAVFIVTGGVDGVTAVSAFRRSRDIGTNPRLIWRNNATDIPDDAWASATYSGGKLYIGALEGLTYVLDANTGNALQVLNTTGQDHSPDSRRVIVDVPDDSGTPQSVMYYLTWDGFIEALSANGTNPLPQVYQLFVVAQPSTIALNSKATISATLKDANYHPIQGAPVTFTTDAAKTLGSIKPTSAKTDASGVATTTFTSAKRTGVATITAQATGAAPASATVTIVKKL